MKILSTEQDQNPNVESLQRFSRVVAFGNFVVALCLMFTYCMQSAKTKNAVETSSPQEIRAHSFMLNINEAEEQFYVQHNRYTGLFSELYGTSLANDNQNLYVTSQGLSKIVPINRDEAEGAWTITLQPDELGYLAVAQEANSSALYDCHALFANKLGLWQAECPTSAPETKTSAADETLNQYRSR